jgi:Integrase core domain
MTLGIRFSACGSSNFAPRQNLSKFLWPLRRASGFAKGDPSGAQLRVARRGLAGAEVPAELREGRGRGCFVWQGAAAAFLDKIVAGMPFPVKAMQVDGGSEFMAEFEVACQTNYIVLYVLPPRSPQMNGAVQRCNGAWRHEFYQTYDVPSGVEYLNPILDSYLHLHNHHRPHGALAGITPAQYLARLSARTPPPSPMS